LIYNDTGVAMPQSLEASDSSEDDWRLGADPSPIRFEPAQKKAPTSPVHMLEEDGQSNTQLFLRKIRSASTVNSDESPLKAGERLSTKFLPTGLNSARLSMKP
jgi:hypothetical protein